MTASVAHTELLKRGALGESREGARPGPGRCFIPCLVARLGITSALLLYMRMSMMMRCTRPAKRKGDGERAIRMHALAQLYTVQFVHYDYVLGFCGRRTTARPAIARKPIYETRNAKATFRARMSRAGG